VQAQVREDLLDHRRLQDRRIDLQFAPDLPAVCGGNWPTVAARFIGFIASLQTGRLCLQ
jgi:hypothetical protein